MLKAARLLVPVLIAACASTPPPATGPEALHGCWIERLANGGANTMRWFPNGEAWRGEAIFYRSAEANRSSDLTLERAGGGWRICTVWRGRPIESSCAPASFGPPPLAPNEPWAEVYATGERLKMVARGSGARARTIIDAARDGCD